MCLFYFFKEENYFIIIYLIFRTFFLEFEFFSSIQFVAS
jgi:hypothetical protein